MALRIKHKETEFGVGDKVRVYQKIKDGDKFRESFFEGMVLKIKGREAGKTFTVRKIAEGNIGVEKIYPMGLPTVDRVVVLKEGTEGVRRAKLYYTRTKSPTEIENIFKKSAKRASIKESAKPKSKSKSSKK